jgi:tetratricopeptide (TPR) repeat protein
MNSTVTPASCQPQNSGKKQLELLSVCDQDSSLLNIQEQERCLRQQALVNAQQGKYAEAIALITQLIDHNPASASHYNNRGLLHFQNGQFEAALADYDQALDLNLSLIHI